MRSWSKPYLSRVFVPSTSIYSIIVGAEVLGYSASSLVEETLVGSLSPWT